MKFSNRVHLFEHNDTPIVPRALRETVIETLGRTLAWGRILRGLVPPFERFLEATGATEVLDLCSGTGMPAAILGDEIARLGRTPPRFLLTDLQPQAESWAALASDRSFLEYVPEPMDATNVPKAISASRVRVIINALHHFRPALAQEILCACADAPGIFVAEGFERTPFGFLPFAFTGIPALLVNPIFAPRRRLQKALLTWATPIALAVSAWDGFVSTLRVYDERELREMVAPLGDAFRWEYGTYDFFPKGRGYYFYGIRSGLASRIGR